MPTTPIAPLSLASLGATASNLGLKLLRSTADVANQNQFAWTGREVLVAINVGVAAHNVSIQSAPYGGRTIQPISAPIAATGDGAGGDMLAWYDFRFGGTWVKTGNIVEFGADHVDVKFVVIRLPF